MTVIANFQSFMATGGLVCPPGKSKIEYGVADEPNLFVECRASEKAIPTWYLRLKNAKGTNTYRKLGTVKELSLAQARKLAQQIKAEHAANLKVAAAVVPVVAKQEMLLSEFVSQLYENHARIHKRSFKKDASLYRLRIGPRFGHLPISAIGRLEVQKFGNELHAEGLSAAYVNHFLVLMRRYFSLCVQWDLLPRNVLKGIELMPVDNFRDTFLSEEETGRLVQVLTTDSNKLVCSILLFLLNTGARKMEAMKAKWSDIELENRLWTVPAVNNKSKKPKTLPLGLSAVQILMNLDSRGKSEYVFPNPATGLPMTSISRVWYRLRKQSGIDPKMRIHDTRACLAQRLLGKNASIETVARILGNHPNMAQARYSRFSTQTLVNAADVGSIPMPQFQTNAVGEAANAGSVSMPQPQAKAA